MTDDEYKSMQLELAHRPSKRPPCDKCESVSYDQLSHMSANDGWIDFDYRAGAYRYCSACKRVPPTFDFDWVEKIPFEKFKQFIDDHPDAFPIEDMRRLLPRVHVPVIL